jgi:hypothetical protein
MVMMNEIRDKKETEDRDAKKKKLLSPVLRHTEREREKERRRRRRRSPNGIDHLAVLLGRAAWHNLVGGWIGMCGRTRC